MQMPPFGSCVDKRRDFQSHSLMGNYLILEGRASNSTLVAAKYGLRLQAGWL